MKECIFLIGYMGSGKSSVGKELSKILGWKFIDLDATIEVIEGKSVTDIFNEIGELGFRKLEQETLLNLIEKKKVIIATGGGTPTYLDNIDFMNRNGITIYLKTHPGTLFHRLAQEKTKRPLIAHLSDVDLMEFILESLKKRLPYYIKSFITVSGEGIPSAIAQQIKNQLKLN